MKIKNKIYQFIVSIVLVVSLLAGAIVPANTIVKADKMARRGREGTGGGVESGAKSPGPQGRKNE